MALHIRDEETDRLVRMLAVGNELRREDEKLSLWERLKPLRDRINSRPDTGLEADKAYYDSLNDE